MITTVCTLLSLLQLLNVLNFLEITKRMLLLEAGVHNPLMSHCYMGFCVCRCEGALKRIVQTRSMKNCNTDAFLADVAGIWWEQGLKDTVDVDILVTQLSPHFPLLLIRMLLFIQFEF